MAKRLKKLTVNEAQALPEDAVILLQDEDGNTVNLGYRHLFQNSGPNRGHWGWVFGHENLQDRDFTDIALEQLDEPGSLIGLKGRRKPLFEDRAEGEKDLSKWRSSVDEAIAELPVGSIVEVQDGEPLGVRLSDGSWIATGSAWTSDQEAEEKYFAEDGISIVTPEAASELGAAL